MTTSHKLRAGLFLLGSLLVFASPTAAQEPGRITGQVTDAQSGQPLSEVQVFIPGTGIGTLTRANGRFIILNVTPGAKELRAERIGMGAATQQVTVAAGQAVDVNFQLSTQALGLDEIVVTGTAGAARRREIGNTIAQVRIGEVPGRTNDLSDMLRGAAPGLNISSSAGDMGQASAIRLRGLNSVSMSNTPIIYIDGVRIRSKATPTANAVDFRSQRGDNVQVSPFAQINPNDIDRIEVIKGSAATTLYGTEASAGVIQIFTKSGSSGAPVWTMETTQSAVWNRKFAPDIDISGTPECQRTGDCSYGFFRWGPYIKTGYNPGYSASVRGGGQNLQYYVSGGYDISEGTLENEYGKKWLTRGNFTFTPLTELTLQWNSSYTHSWAQNVSQSNSQGYGHNVVRGLANFFANDSVYLVNEVLKYDLQSWIDRLTTGGTATWSPMADLTNRFTIGWDFIQKDSRNLRPVGFFRTGPGQLLTHNWQDQVLTFDYVGTYSFDVMSNLRSSFSWGGQAVGDNDYTLEGWGENFPGATDPTVSSAASRQGFETRSKTWNAGFFLQNVFDISNRYFITAGMRVDGNSAFGSGFGLQMYPKVSGSWVVSDEAFWPEIGTFKLRAAFGKSGRAPGAFDAVRTWSSANGSFLNLPAFVPLNRGNPDLGPEVTAEVEGGFDSSWMDDKVRLDLTYYRSTTSDALLNVPGVPSAGFSASQLENVGKLRNQGLEVALNTSPINGADLGWDLGLNVTLNKSEVLDLGEGRTQLSTPTTSIWIIVGQPIPVFRARYIRNPDAIATPLADCGLPAAVADPSLPCVEQNHLYGSGQPKTILSPSTQLRYKGITLAVRGEYKGGHYYQDGNIEPGAVTRGATVPSCAPYYAALGATNALKPLDQVPALWRARCTANQSQADYFIYKADFFRLRTVSATLPLDVLMPDRITSSMMTLSLNNSWTWKAMPILDPELGQNGAVEELAIQSSPRLPPPIQFVASVRVTF
jgi:outer membrane receptor protein involved in Fe transport